ncbi:MAG: efflux RND transporter periplasmic adaptor subunit [Acidobacteria bacterium]|nr:efflux RND transporter periplasmic adaptor subunit [Acidobacteriota bacterium]
MKQTMLPKECLPQGALQKTTRRSESIGRSQSVTSHTQQLPRVREHGGATLRAVLWALAGALVMLFLVIDPLGISPLDGWLGLHEASTTAAPRAGAEPAAGHEHKQLWTCAMHPQVIEDHPGTCPICGMDLVPVKDEGQKKHENSMGAGTMQSSAAAPTAAPEGKGKILFYRNPMDPTITSPVPRKDEMGMDYVPVYANEAESAANQGAVVTIDPAVEQNMNVVTAKVSRRDIKRQVRTVGYLDYDQEKMVSVTTKYPGFIEKTYVNYVGQPVRKGQPLFDIYSPQLVQTEQELLSAKRYADRMADAPGGAAGRAQSLLAAARERLAYWDITEDQIHHLETTGEILRALQVVAPSSGVVMKRMPGLEGMAVQPGMELLHIANLSDLWLTVEVFEDQLPWVNIGSPAKITMTYFPGETFTGKVRFIEPAVSDKTRTVQLTLEIPNPRRRLLSGMYATVLFEPVAARNAIAVPTQAVLRTGERNVVIVALGHGRFAPRDVTLGPEGDGYVQVLSGLDDNAEIVTSSQFLIDSESNLKEALQKMIEAKRAETKGGGK